MTTSVAVVGAGGIGTVLASRLGDAGLDVTLCRRTPIESVLLTETDGAVRRVQLPVAVDPATVGPVDWVLIACKAQDTRGTASWLDRLVDSHTGVVLVQNGIDHRARLDGLVPSEQIVPALARLSAEQTEPGRVTHHSGNLLVVDDGEPAHRFATALRSCDLQVRCEPEFLTAAWKKLLGNAAANPISALTLGRMAIFGTPNIRELATAVLAETVAVGLAAGALLDGDDVDRALATYAALPPHSGCSMLYDRLAGRPLEHEFLTGAIVATADRYGVPVPVNRTLLALLRAVVPAGTGAGTDPPERTI